MKIAETIRNFFAPSTAKALKGFQKATAQLRRVAELEEAEAERQDWIAHRATVAAADADARAREATRIADKLADLVA